MSFLLDCSLRVGVILALGFVLTFWPQKGSAALRHLIWLSVFAVAFLTPLLAAFGPKLLRPPELKTHAARIGAVTVTGASLQGEPTPAPPAIPYGGIIWALWATGALVCAVRIVRSVAKARTLRASAERVEFFEGILVAESESAAVAMTLGIRAPLIVLPIAHRKWSSHRRRTVLLHELAHVRRRDCLLQWLSHAVCALHWFNPLAWLASSQMLCEAERACDDAVVSNGASGTDFARELLEIAASASRLKGPDPMTITVASKLERRIARLLDTSANRQPLTRARSASAIAAAFIVLLPLAGIRAQEAQPGAPGQPGSVSGTVTDPSGARVPYATIDVSGPSGSRAFASRADGTWIETGLAPGLYQVQVSMRGFATLHRTVTLAAGASVQIEQPLAIGQATQSITIVAAGTPRPAPQAAPEPPAVGGSLQAARAVFARKPPYPAALREQGVTGTVVISGIIAKSGELLNARIVDDQGHPELAEAALPTVSTWRYQPALLNGAPVETVTTITINYQLQ